MPHTSYLATPAVLAWKTFKELLGFNKITYAEAERIKSKNEAKSYLSLTQFGLGFLPNWPCLPTWLLRPFSARSGIFFCLKTNWRRVCVKRQKKISFRAENSV